MTDKENEEIMGYVRTLLEHSDYDFVLITTRRLDNEIIDGNIGMRTSDGFEAAAHVLLTQALAKNGEVPRTFFLALEVVLRRMQQTPEPPDTNIMFN